MLASPRRQQQKQRRSSLLQAHDFPPFSRFALDARAAGLPTAYAPPLPPHLVDQLHVCSSSDNHHRARRRDTLL